MDLSEFNLSQINIAVNNECNLRCVFCSVARKLTECNYDMDENLFKKIIGEINNKAVVTIAGGEPFLYFLKNPQLYDVLYENNYVIPEFLSNGLLFSKQSNLISHLKENKKETLLSFSVDGMYEDYEYLRRGSSWNQVEDNLKLAGKIKEENSKVAIRVNYIITQQTVGHLKDFVAFAEQQNVDFIHLRNLIYHANTEKYFKSDFDTLFIDDIYEYEKELQKTVDYIDNNNLNIGLVSEPISGTKQIRCNYKQCDLGIAPLNIKEKNVFCILPFKNIVIDQHGQVYPCCCGENIIVGNCKEKSLYEIFNGNEMQRIRQDMQLKVAPVYADCTEAYKSRACVSLKKNYKNGKSHVAEMDFYDNIITEYKDILKQNIDDAIQYLEQVQNNLVEFDKKSILIWNELAGVYLYRKSDYDNASKYIDKILELNPNSIQALMKKGIVLIFKKYYDEALILFKKLDSKKDPFVLFWMGYVYEKKGDVEDALFLYSDFIKKDIDVNIWGYKNAKKFIEEHKK